MNEQRALENVRREIEGLSGHLGFYYKNLVSGAEDGVRDTEIYGAALALFAVYTFFLIKQSKRYAKQL